jgi:integrase
VKKPTFKPVWFEGRDYPWAINVPPYLSPTGKPQRRFFLLKRDADAFGSHMRRQAEDHEHGATYLSRDRLGDAAKAYDVIAGLEELTGRRHTLLEIVQDFADRKRQESKSVSLEVLFDEYLAARADRSHAYLKQLRWFKSKLFRLGPRMVCAITAGDIESALRRETPSNRNGFLRYLRAIFGFGIKRGYLERNPISQIEFSTVKQGEPQVYKPDEVARLLDDCMANDLGLLPYRVLTLYAGIRPRGEMSRIEWDDINWQDRIIKLKASITKKGRSRFPAISPNAMEWLSVYRRMGGQTDGRIVKYTRSQLEARCKANCHRTGVRSIPNGARHSYCSYHLAMHQDINALTLQSGHASTDILWRHYYQAATREDAQRYWSIVPKAATSNIVAIAS